MEMKKKSKNMSGLKNKAGKIRILKWPQFYFVSINLQLHKLSFYSYQFIDHIKCVVIKM